MEKLEVVLPLRMSRGLKNNLEAAAQILGVSQQEVIRMGTAELSLEIISKKSQETNQEGPAHENA